MQSALALMIGWQTATEQLHWMPLRTRGSEVFFKTRGWLLTKRRDAISNEGN
jgi:hypothetical protein